MFIGSIIYQSLVDVPGKVAGGAFTTGCNLSCPWCHNKRLLEIKGREMKPSEVIDRIANPLIDAIFLSGGEPCLQDDIVDFFKEAQDRGYYTALYTNGMFPDVIKQLTGWVDEFHVGLKEGIVVGETVKVLDEAGCKVIFRDHDGKIVNFLT